jgi:hypothetical protein
MRGAEYARIPGDAKPVRPIAQMNQVTREPGPQGLGLPNAAHRHRRHLGLTVSCLAPSRTEGVD